MQMTVPVLFGLMLFGGCKKGGAPPPPPPPVVTVARPLQEDVIEWDEYTGNLEAVESVDVRARVSGLIVSAPFGEGSIVKQGDLLVEIDVRPFQAELDSRIADEARAAAQVELADIEFRRIKNLPPDSTSPIELERAEASLREAKAVLAGAGAAAESARLNVEWCRVTAPITGRIGRKLVTPGNLITGGGEQATLLTTIASIDPIYCYVDADERSVLKYQQMAREGKRVSAREAYIPCFLKLADESGFVHEGVIDFVDNRVDPGTGTMRGRGVFPNPQGWLTPGFFARMRVPGSGSYRALLVPDAAVTTDQDQKLLMVVGPDDTVEPRPVKLGALFGQLRAIETGIGPDDRVVINGMMHARPGAKVAPQEGAIPAAPEDLVMPTTQDSPAAETRTQNQVP